MRVLFLRSGRDKSKSTFDFLFPVLKARRLLLDLGYEIEVSSDLSGASGRCDVLCVLSSCVRYHHDDAKFMDRLRSNMDTADRSLFFDTSDSAGGLYGSVLECCHRYLKKQVYADRGLYRQSAGDARLHFDFYKTQHDIEYPTLRRPVVSEEISESLGVSWNLGLGDYRDLPMSLPGALDVMRRLQVRWLGRPIDVVGFRHRYADPGRPGRDVDVMGCFSTHGSVPPLAAHRRQSRDVLEEMSEQLSVVTGFLKTREYCDVLRRSKVSVCPFGWGEITWRDFETFLRGITVVKPDMGHVETWPDYFLPGATYLPYSWDASDLAEVLSRALGEPDELEQIARRGQDRFRRHDVLENPDPFVERFRNVIEAAT